MLNSSYGWTLQKLPANNFSVQLCKVISLQTCFQSSMYAHKLLLYLHLVHGTHISTYMHRSIYWNPFRVSMTISHQWREACASNVQKERLVDDKQQFDNKGEMIFFKYALHDTIRQLFCKKNDINEFTAIQIKTKTQLWKTN